MNERVIEILVYLISELQSSKDEEQNIEVLSQDLITQGYSQKEINFALNFLFERKDNFAEEFDFSTEFSQSYFRLLNPQEKFLITTEAHGLLLQLRQSNLITDAEFELILEKVLLAGLHRIDQEEMKNIVENIIFNNDSHQKDGYFYLDNSYIVH